MIQSITLQTRGLTLGASASGDVVNPALLLLHGWPHSRSLYDGVLEDPSADFFVLAPDLPGIGDSHAKTGSGEKIDIADLILRAAAGARHIIVAGLDVGGMIAFAAARDHGDRLAAAAIMNTIIPGIEPWSKVIADPRNWHFAFHAIPELPELLVSGRERAYFDFFHDALARDPRRIPQKLRTSFAEAYQWIDALRTGFGWYRAMNKDAERNAEATPISTPLLCMRGDADGRPIEPYIEGLRAAGAEHVEGRIIPDCGELLPVEAPEAFVDALRPWLRATLQASGNDKRSSTAR